MDGGGRQRQRSFFWVDSFAADQLGRLGTPIVTISMAQGKVQYTYEHKVYNKFADIHEAYRKKVEKDGRTNGYSFILPHEAPESLRLYAYIDVPSGYYVTELLVDGVNKEGEVRDKLRSLIEIEYEKAIKKYDGPEYQVRNPGDEADLAVINAYKDANAAVKAQLAVELNLK